MKNTKVYGSKFTVLLMGLFLGMSLFVLVKKLGEPDAEITKPILIVVFGLFLFLVAFNRALTPRWTYDESGVTMKNSFKPKDENFWPWSEVVGIYRRAYWSWNYYIDFKRGGVMVSFLWTSNHLRILVDAVHFAQKNNPNVEITPSVLGKVKKYFNR